MPYREKAERPPIPAEGRRWYTQQDGVEKGPFEETALVRAVKSGMLRHTTRVRAEDETEWRPLSHVKKLEAQIAPAPRTDYDERKARLMAPIAGSFGAGFVAGLLGGCIGLFVVLIVAKGQETKRGAAVGFAVQAAVGVMMRVIAASNG